MERTFATATLALILAATAAHVDFSAQASKLTSATLTFRCTGAAVSATNPPNPCTDGDAIVGDSLGPYVGGPTGGRTIAQGAYIDSSGELYFVIQQASGRAVFFDFSNMLAAGGSPNLRTFSSIWSVHMGAGGMLCGPVDANGNTLSLYNMPLNQAFSGQCRWNFYDTEDTTDTYLWTVRFDPTNYPGTSPVRITRTTPVSGTQYAWTIQANAASPTTGAVAELLASTTSGKYVTYGEGFYQMPFGLSLTQP
jgi:hypothetical protein